MVPTPTGGHQKINWRLVAWLERNLPVGYEPQFALGIAVGVRNTLEPDALVLRSPVDLTHHYYTPDQVVIAVEIVSPTTRRRDRMEKPLLYARAGIPHYWRVDLDEQEAPTLVLCKLAGAAYRMVETVPAGESVLIEVPFRVELRPAELVGPRRRD